MVNHQDVMFSDSSPSEASGRQTELHRRSDSFAHPDECPMDRRFVMSEQRPLIAVVDDDPAVLGGLVRLLERHALDVRPFACAESLLASIGQLVPDCIVADLSMPGLNGLDMQSKLAEWKVDCPIVFISGHGDIRTSVQAMRAGAEDFLTKPFDQEELLRVVQHALSRRERAQEASEQLGRMRRCVASLTPREREVYELVVVGCLNKQIASALGISEKTVKVHRARVMRKMAVRSVAQLARIAEQIGNPQGIG